MLSPEAALIGPDDGRWVEALTHVTHEFYHEPRYVTLEAERQDGQPCALWFRDGGRVFLVPLILQPLPGWAREQLGMDLADATSPYGYPGPLVCCELESRSAFISAAVNAVAKILRARGVVCAFVRLSPMLNHADDYSSHGEVVEHGPTYWIDLTATWDDVRGQMRRRFQGYVRAAARAGVAARFDNDWQHIDRFVELYHQTMDRVGAARSYYFDKGYFLALREALGGRLKLCVAEYGVTTAAAGLFAESAGIVQYLFSGGDVAAGHPHATKVMMAFVRDWAKSAGHRAFFLGGGYGGREDSLSQFKRGFSRSTSPFRSWRLVFDDDVYERVVRAAAERSGESAEGSGGFFPAYRWIDQSDRACTPGGAKE